MASIIVDYPTVAPAKCFNCGSADNKDGRRYVQTSIQVRLYGRVYICGLCMVEIGHEFGLISSQSYDEMGELNFRLIEEMNSLKVENDKLRRAFNILDFIGLRGRNDIPVNEEPSEATERAVEAGKGKDSGPAKSSTKQGPNNVLKSDSDSKPSAA